MDDIAKIAAGLSEADAGSLRRKIAEAAYSEYPAMTSNQFTTYPYTFSLAEGYSRVSANCRSRTERAYAIADKVLAILDARRAHIGESHD